MSKKFDIIGIDSPCMDFALNVDRLPTSNMGSPLNDYSWQGGGKVASGMISAGASGMSSGMDVSSSGMGIASPGMPVSSCKSIVGAGVVSGEKSDGE